MYETILFDLDGTLTDPKEGITKCVQYALDHFDIKEENPDKLTLFIGPPLLESFTTYYGLTEEQAHVAIKKYRERFAEKGIYENKVYEGVVDVLDSLKKAGKRIVLATSKPEIFADKILENYGLKPYFDEIAGGDLEGKIRHKHEVIQEIFRRLEIKEEDKAKLVMVGDRKYDILGAKECGLNSIGLRIGYAEENELEEAGAELILNNMAELKAVLLG